MLVGSPSQDSASNSAGQKWVLCPLMRSAAAALPKPRMQLGAYVHNAGPWGTHTTVSCSLRFLGGPAAGSNWEVDGVVSVAIPVAGKIWLRAIQALSGRVPMVLRGPGFQALLPRQRLPPRVREAGNGRMAPRQLRKEHRLRRNQQSLAEAIVHEHAQRSHSHKYACVGYPGAVRISLSYDLLASCCQISRADVRALKMLCLCMKRAITQHDAGKHHQHNH